VDRSELRVELWPLERLIPYTKNPRVISPAAIEKVATSIKHFGFRQPIVVDRKGVIVVGHARRLAALQMGLKRVPVHVAKDLSERAARAYHIADNRSNEATSWDRELLAIELKDLGEAAGDLTGFDGNEIAEIFGSAPTEAPQDAIPAPPVSPVARPGQIWRLGTHRLLCGDSTRPEDVSRLMGEERAVLFATDPPYAIGYTGGTHPLTKANRANARAKRIKDKDWSGSYHEAGPTPDIANSEADGRAFYASFIRTAIEKAITPNAAWYCWHASNRQAMVEEVWKDAGAFMHQQIIWFKSRPVLTFSVYMWAHEPCLFGWIKGKKPHIERKQEGGYPGTVWQVPCTEIESSEHPTSKPNRLFAIPMQLHTRPNDLCYEPFSGSGSQLIAAEQLGRRCYAIEIEPRFVDVAITRWETLTGKKAELIDQVTKGDAVARQKAKAHQAAGRRGKSRQAAA
jgi:DNA modification methylase